ncbi:hypothetical protein [Flavobacterium faecale]|uniref:hypothetical protein n=1 Tax=Flavobacterium faecale TaxID=1355330 RepID=UPI003AAD4619
MKKLSFVLVTSLMLTSCSQDLFNFTLISTKNIELSKLSSLEKSSERVKGQDKMSLIVFFPTKRIKIDQAVSNTIEAVPGCVALIDGTVHSKFWWIPYIYGESKFVVEATPLIDPTTVKPSKELPRYGKLFLDKKGRVKSIESISEVVFTNEKNKIQEK